jgi:2-polyprenyl-6-methoxyphenol hydroxylase-like FAD-dependent oxidoreductase
MNSHYDVVIVGGRVAGASTALLLARAGTRVALVERSPYGSDTLSTHGLMRAGVLQLSRWGLLGAIVAAGTPPIRETTFHYADGESTHVSIRPSSGVDALYAPRRYLLDRILVDAAAEAGADVRHETTVTALLRDGNGRVIGVRTRDRGGRSTDLRAAITVGADGVRSTIADLVEAPVVRSGSSGGAFLYRYHTDLGAAGYEWAYGDGASAGFLPTNDGLTCVFVGTRPDRLRPLVRREGTAGAFRTLLGQAGPRLAERVAAATPTGAMRGWAGVAGSVRRSWGPGWALVGDAGYYKDPVTTHGITDALRDAELLADELLELLVGLTPEAVALARYQATRDRLSRRLFEATEAVASYDWNLQDVRALLRPVSSAMSDEVDHLSALPERRTTAVRQH